MYYKKTCIISLGGSIIVPDNINTEYLTQFKGVVLDAIENGWRFIIITGGGKTARKYIEGATKIDSSMVDEDKDWLGIHSTRLNAHLVRTIFREHACPVINTNPHDLGMFYECDASIAVVAGWRPGRSTDFAAVVLAEHLGIDRVVNFTNVDYAYNKDPRTNEDAQIIQDTTWSEFQKIVGDKWIPGLNVPFDPIASKRAGEIGLNVSIMNGTNLENFQDYLAGREYIGTKVHA